MSEVVIWAEKWREMQLFYCTLLSTDATSDSPDFISIVGKSNTVQLHKVPDEYVDDSETVVERSEAPIKPVFAVSSIASTLNAIGVTPLRQGEYQAKTYVDVVDPDGNVISIKEVN